MPWIEDIHASLAGGRIFYKPTSKQQVYKTSEPACQLVIEEREGEPVYHVLEDSGKQWSLTRGRDGERDEVVDYN